MTKTCRPECAHSPAVGVLVLAPEEGVDKRLRLDRLPPGRADQGLVIAVLGRTLRQAGVCTSKKS